MSGPRNRGEDDATTGTWSLAQAAASSGMVAVVGVVLLASWILEAEPRPAREDLRPAPSARTTVPATVLAPIVEVPDARPPASVAAPPPAPVSSPSPLAQRALRDAGRLAAHRDAWTAQIAAVCSEDSVAALVRKAGASDRLYLVPVTIAGRACFRVLWGTYPSASAAAATDLPARLGVREKPRALAVAGVLR